jgi:D-tyrosyl-tRNA(Tyr) deacylase
LCMRVVIQRVKEASVSVQGVKISEIQKGLLILVGVETQDTQQDIDWLVAKVAKLRIFEDPLGAMNVSLQDIDADVIVVSQFTLHASTKKGNRPSFIKAAKPEVAIPLYQGFVDSLEKQLDKKIQTGQFGAMMDVALINDGPVTITIDSKNKE